MELRLVYRFLRKISDWTMSGFYSEVYVEGKENVRRDVPLIVASTHHNEIIDIAALAVTMPYRRHLSFWAKSSMFTNPISRAILLSSGAIPVKRNPNNGSTTTSSPSSSSTGHGNVEKSNLFRESSYALAAGQVIGVFPEGTSYTQPSIMQTMPGAAWAAVDYIMWTREQGGEVAMKGKELTIVPVGIVYTDKASYQSRVCIRYGQPIIVDSYLDVFGEGVDVGAATRDATKRIMVAVENQMRAMSVNAPDWATLYAAQMARDILWEDPMNIPLKDWVSISQVLVDAFTRDASVEDSHLDATKRALVKYYALLYYTDITHPSLSNALSIITRPFYSLVPFPLHLISFISFIPSMLLHIPAYLTGSLAARTFVKKGEVEGEAQFKAIFGGLGAGIGTGLGVTLALKKFSRSGFERIWKFLESHGCMSVEEALPGSIGKKYGSLALIYISIWLLVKWHSALVHGNYVRLKTTLTLYKLCSGLLLKRPVVGDDDLELERYARLPNPPPNPFIKKQQQQSISLTTEKTIEVTVAPRKLIRPLLAARMEAIDTLRSYLRDSRDSELAQFLVAKNARLATF